MLPPRPGRSPATTSPPSPDSPEPLRASRHALLGSGQARAPASPHRSCRGRANQMMALRRSMNRTSRQRPWCCPTCSLVPTTRNPTVWWTWVPQLDPLLIMRIWPVSCGNRPDSGIHRVYLGARVPAGQRGRQSARRPAVYRRQTVTYQYILPLDWGRTVTLSTSHVCAERSRLTERLPAARRQPCRRSLLTCDDGVP